MGGRIKRQILMAAGVLLGICALLCIYVIYIMAFEGESLAKNPLNPRNSIVSEDILRGTIYDSKGRVLAKSDAPGGREYPLGEAVAHAVGYCGELSGTSGVEGYENTELLGTSEQLDKLGPGARLFATGRGNDVRLTIDADAQQAAWDALGGRKGAAVVLDGATGAVLVLVSSPSFDPEGVEENWKELLEREDSPLMNRALSGLYPPGSSIKPMIADMALEAGITDGGEIFECTGSIDVGNGFSIKESHDEVHGAVTLGEAIRKSCNVTFGTLAMRLKGTGLSEGFRRFGFDRTIRGEISLSPCHLPDFPTLDQGDVAQVGIGQSTLLVTPMHMALLASAFANGGVIMKPFIVSEVLTPEGTVLSRAAPESWIEATDEERTARISGWMETVVESGTGTAAAIPGVRIAGKTGTAENPFGDDHAWFMGTADIHGRLIAFAVLVENGGEGGKAAAPVARKIIESLI